MFALAGDESADRIGFWSESPLFLGQPAIADLEDRVVGGGGAGRPASKQITDERLKVAWLAASRLVPAPRTKASACRTTIRWGGDGSGPGVHEQEG
jgi:hypothetical protein